MTNTASTGKVEFNMSGRQTKTVSLPSFPWSEVVVYSSLLVSEQREIEAKYKNEDNTIDKSKEHAVSFELVAKSIKSWNFTQDWKDLQIDVQVLEQFPTIDFLVLNEAISGKKLTHKNENGDLVVWDGEDLDNKKK